MDGGAGAPQNGAAAAQLTDRQRTLAFLTVLIAFVLEVADTTIVNTALPEIRRALDASSAAMQWIVAGYLLVLGALLLLGGRLGDAFGYRRMFLIGVGGFIATSALCGLAQTPEQLVIGRLLQGAAGAMMGPQVMAIVQTLFSPLERVERLAWFGVIGGLAAILGPILGGLLIEWDWFGLGWRLIFLINLPIGLIALWLGLRTIPQRGAGLPLQIDLIGAALFAAGFAALLFALIDGSERGWPAWAIPCALVGVALVSAGWIRALARRRAGLAAIVEPALFRLITFRWGLVAVLAFSAGAAGFLLVLAIALQQGLGKSPLDTALAHGPFGLGVMAGISLIGKKYLPRFGRWLLIGGALVMMTGASGALILIAGGTGSGVGFFALLAVAGIGMGMLAGPLPPVVVADVDRAFAGTASATLRTAQQLGGATGIAAIGSAYFAAAAQTGGALAGLPVAGALFIMLLLLAILAAWRLPADIFGVREEKSRRA
ncbi:MAG: MFS transporter [Sphingomonas sp.]|uniref:MFS transporter n=1 Tax=Sphingomonas sp. TaxID=28214 RepID=UPI0026075378|nr:MFS transporter [Sphingomonas sp.]MDK2766198.1 MFS transporter [Sphingomonas sp.]